MFLSLITVDEISDTGIISCLFDRSIPILILDGRITAIAHQRVDSLVILIIDCDYKRSIAPLISTIDVGPSQH